MAKIIYLRCRHCGEPLQESTREYCSPCNLYLAYRAMPLILGMVLLPASFARLVGAPVERHATWRAEARSYDDESFLTWE